jgi:hypothetical protein
VVDGSLCVLKLHGRATSIAVGSGIDRRRPADAAEHFQPPLAGQRLTDTRLRPQDERVQERRDLIAVRVHRHRDAPPCLCVRAPPPTKERAYRDRMPDAYATGKDEFARNLAEAAVDEDSIPSELVGGSRRGRAVRF